MTTVRVYRCSCGGVPEVSVSQVAEDLMEATAYCGNWACDETADPVEHVWGGEEIRIMAFEEWNDKRRSEGAKKAKR